MSGAASNSAARRRRAGGLGGINESESTTQIVGQASVGQANGATPIRAPHPMQILENHEIRLREIEKDDAEFKQSILNSFTERIITLETSNIEQIQDIKNQLSKLQNFAIEINLVVMKLQAQMEKVSNGIKTPLDEGNVAGIDEQNE